MPTFHQTMRTLTFTGQHTNPVRAQRRRNIALAGGIRQYKRLERMSKGL